MTLRAVVVGVGAVGARAARQLHSQPGAPGQTEVLLSDAAGGRATAVARSLGSPATGVSWPGDDLDGIDVVVLATPAGNHRELAERALERGAHVVSVTDDLDETRGLLGLDAEARERGLSVVAGAGFSPGLTCLLARHAASELSFIEEVHVAKSGTGGPSCARQHHRALRTAALDWRDGQWASRAAGSGRELNWFPDPVGGLDCYRAALADALLLHPAFPTATRITARASASRRDRITARLPMLRRPHPEGAVGAVRVEVRGRRGAATDTVVLGAIDRPAMAAGAVAAVAAIWVSGGRLARPGAGGLAELVADPAAFLHDLAVRGVRAAVFEGEATP